MSKIEEYIPTAVLVLAALVLPNLLFTGGYVLGMTVGSRTFAIISYFLLFALPAPLWARLMLFPVILLLDTISVAAGTFGFDFPTMVVNIRYAFAINSLSNELYMSVAASAAFVLVSVFVLTITQNTVFRRARLLPIIPLFLGLLIFDGMNSTTMSALPGTLKPEQFSSAVVRSDFSETLERSGKRDVLLVMVESLGMFMDDDLHRLAFDPLLSPEIQKTHDIDQGSTPFWGSTTAAELRELCALTDDFRVVMHNGDPECLPDKFAAVGYETVAFHAFKSTYFQRDQWLPTLGFQKLMFLEDLATNQNPARCGEVWKGLCDGDVALAIEQELADGGKPAFLYWLTFNTHVPVGQSTTGELNCPSKVQIDDEEVCRMIELWREVLGDVADIATQNPDLDILVVGDHRPPLLRRTARGLFSDETVPWIRLVPKSARIPTAAPPMRASPAVKARGRRSRAFP